MANHKSIKMNVKITKVTKGHPQPFLDSENTEVGKRKSSCLKITVTSIINRLKK